MSRRPAIATAILFAAGLGANAAVVYDFESIPIDTPVPIVFPDGTEFFGSTGATGFKIVNFDVFRLSGHTLRNQDFSLTSRSLGIRFPQTYNSIQLDFALASNTLGPSLSMYLFVGGFAHPVGQVTSQGEFHPGWVAPEGQFLFEGTSFDSVLLVGCQNASPAGCDISVAPDFAFAIDNVKVAEIPEPGAGALFAAGALAAAAFRRRFR